MDNRESLLFDLISERLEDLHSRSTRALARLDLSESDLQFENERAVEWRSDADSRERLYVRGLLVQLTRVRMIRNQLERRDYLNALRHAVDTLVTSEMVLNAEIGANLREINRARAKAPRCCEGIFQLLLEVLSSTEHGSVGFSTAGDIWEDFMRYEDFSPREVEVDQLIYLVFREKDRLWQECESTEQVKSISFSTFQNYLTRARQALHPESE